MLILYKKALSSRTTFGRIHAKDAYGNGSATRDYLSKKRPQPRPRRGGQSNLRSEKSN